MNLKISRLVLNAKCEIVCSRSVHIIDCLVMSKIKYTLSLIFIRLQVMKKYLKLRKHNSKNIDKFF